MISSFHGMISSFHAVFVLRHRDKSTKVIDYNDQVIRVRGYLLFRGISSPMFLLLSHFLLYLCGASFQGYGHKKTPGQMPQSKTISLPFRCGATRNRTGDTRIFSPLLYQLSYGTICGLRVQSYYKYLIPARVCENLCLFFVEIVFLGTMGLCGVGCCRQCRCKFLVE